MIFLLPAMSYASTTRVSTNSIDLERQINDEDVKQIIRILYLANVITLEQHNIIMTVLSRPSVQTGVSTTSNQGTLSVAPILLLGGGLVRSGQTVPISYLQMVNNGSAPIRIKGFWIKQNGNAPVNSIVELSTVDDKGGSNGSVKSPVFKNGSAFAPTEATIQPGQMKLFTIKASMGNDLGLNIGKQFMIDVTSIDSDATTKGKFPIRGTTWVIEG